MRRLICIIMEAEGPCSPLQAGGRHGVVRIVSRGSEAFRDRTEAGQALAHELRELRGQRPVVLGIPRGGILVARELATALDGQLDIVLARKLRTPGQSELAMGSVSEGGRVFLNDMVVGELDVPPALIEHERVRQLDEIGRRRDAVRKVRAKVGLLGRLVIVTDDGLATGATAQAAIWAARQERPLRLVAAFPVGPEHTVYKLAEDVDEIVCLRVPSIFYAVGQFYMRFEAVEDEDVLRVLEAESAREKAKPQGTSPVKRDRYPQGDD